MRKLILASLMVLFSGFVVASEGAYKGINEVALNVYPDSNYFMVANSLPRYLKLNPDSKTKLTISINIHKGGMVNFNQIYFGTVQLDIFRRAAVFIEDDKETSKSNYVLKDVSIWTDSKAIYNDVGGSGLDQNVYDSITRLLLDSPLE